MCARTSLSQHSTQGKWLQRELDAGVCLAQLAEHPLGICQLRVHHRRLHAAVFQTCPAVQFAVLHDQNAKHGDLWNDWVLHNVREG